MSERVFFWLLVLFAGLALYGGLRRRFALSVWGFGLTLLLVATDMLLRSEALAGVVFLYAMAAVQIAIGVVRYRQQRT
jgi:hypothetical protein